MAVEEQEKFSFQAEVVQLLDLMFNSLYSTKEISLRELTSNASDAIDRLRLELLSRSELPEAEGPLQIRVGYDQDARTITIADNGIGMSRAEVIEHIGTIAKSGTREFLQALTGDQRQDATLIGQFGVGFYSAFIVADRVVLTTRRSGLPATARAPLSPGPPGWCPPRAGPACPPRTASAGSPTAGASTRWSRPSSRPGARRSSRTRAKGR